MGLKYIQICVDDKGDRNCPNCGAEDKDLFLAAPRLKHNRTELGLSGHCQQCGCDFIFTYVLFVSDVEYN